MTASMRRPSFPPAGWVQVPELVGRPAVTEAQAAANLKRRHGPTTATPAAEGLLPGEWDASRLLRAVANGQFPPPQLIPGAVPALGWHTGTVDKWVEAHTTTTN